MQMLCWCEIYANRSENSSESVFTVTFSRDRATQALEHDAVRAKLANVYVSRTGPAAGSTGFSWRDGAIDI